MIVALLVLSGVVLLGLPGMFGQPSRLPAAEWARITGASLMLGFAALEIGLFLLGLPTLLRALHAAGVASICEHVLNPLAPAGDLLGGTAALLAAVIAVRAWRAGRCARRNARVAEVEPWLGRHEDRGDYELVVLPTAKLVAVSVPAAQPQILISDGLVDRLDTNQLEAVIRHEATHHRFGHWRFTLLATSLEQALCSFPLVTRSTGALRTALEAWADEAAAGGSASGRSLVCRTIVALTGQPRDPKRRGPSQLTRERTQRLERVPRRGGSAVRLITYAPIVITGMSAFVMLVGSFVGVGHASALVGYCVD